MSEIINLNNVENIVVGQTGQEVKVAFVSNEFRKGLIHMSFSKLYNKDTFDWTDGGRFTVLTDENFETIKAQTDKRVSKVRFNYNYAYKYYASGQCGANMIDKDTGAAGWGAEWLACEWQNGIRLDTEISNGLNVSINQRDGIQMEYLTKISDGVYEFPYPENKNIWFESLEPFFNNQAVAFLIEDV